MRLPLRHTTSGLTLAALLLLAACDTTTTETVSVSPSPTASAPSAHGVTRLPVCHRAPGDEDGYTFIRVAEPAYDNHIAHGDLSIGDPVPDMEGYIFGEGCEPITCPCFGEAEVTAWLDNALTTGLDFECVDIGNIPEVDVWVELSSNESPDFPDYFLAFTDNVREPDSGQALCQSPTTERITTNLPAPNARLEVGHCADIIEAVCSAYGVFEDYTP